LKKRRLGGKSTLKKVKSALNRWPEKERKRDRGVVQKEEERLWKKKGKRRGPVSLLKTRKEGPKKT